MRQAMTDNPGGAIKRLHQFSVYTDHSRTFFQGRTENVKRHIVGIVEAAERIDLVIKKVKIKCCQGHKGKRKGIS